MERGIKMKEDKLLIEVDNGDKYSDNLLIRVTAKAHALVSDVAQRSGRSRAYIASKMIEYAYDHIEYSGDEAADRV